MENSLELTGEDVEASIGVRVQASTIISESSKYKTFYLLTMTFNTSKKEFANKESLLNESDLRSDVHYLGSSENNWELVMMVVLNPLTV